MELYCYIRFCAKVDLLKIEKKLHKNGRCCFGWTCMDCAGWSETTFYAVKFSFFACCKPYNVVKNRFPLCVMYVRLNVFDTGQDLTTSWVQLVLKVDSRMSPGQTDKMLQTSELCNHGLWSQLVDLPYKSTEKHSVVPPLSLRGAGSNVTHGLFEFHREWIKRFQK